jgi:integrase
MPRDPKPWYRQDRDAWFVTINGRRFNLGPDREAAHTRFHELMLNAGDDRPLNGVSMFRLFDDYLEWAQAQRSARTYEWYCDFLQQFSKFLKVDRPAESLKPYDVLRWTSRHPNWSSTYQNNAIRSVQRPYRWAHRLGLLDRNPMEYIEKPSPRSRQEFLTPDEYKAILPKITSKRFKDLIIAAWETGARPQELFRVEVRHVDLANARWVFPPNESKVKTRHRIIYLNDEAQRITREALTRVNTGPLFRNRVGGPWNPWAIGCQFTRLKPLIGRRVCMYMFRHSFATRMLTSGVDPMTVATLLGHSDPSMLARVYQHLSQCPQHLVAQLNRVSNPNANV